MMVIHLYHSYGHGGSLFFSLLPTPVAFGPSGDSHLHKHDVGPSGVFYLHFFGS